MESFSKIKDWFVEILPDQILQLVFCCRFGTIEFVTDASTLSSNTIKYDKYSSFFGRIRSEENGLKRKPPKTDTVRFI